MDRVRIGLVGAGTVGRGLLAILRSQGELLRRRSGLDLSVVAVCDRSWQRKSEVLAGIPASDDPSIVLSNADVDIVVELIGGIDPAREIVLEALRSGKHVVTGNKALLARHGREIHTAAAGSGSQLGFEAAVAGALPVIRPLRRALISNSVRGIYGILNGTCNFIITRMQNDGMDYAQALALAQERGFAEADPSFDVDGNDAAQKLAILAGLAFDTIVEEHHIPVEGIRNIRQVDLILADRMGWEIRLLATARVQDDSSLLMRVHPAMIPKGHILSSVTDEKNAVFFDTSHSGPVLIMGLGAGALPTAAAVVSDLVAIGQQDPARPERYLAEPESQVQFAQTGTYRNYLRIPTLDRPGVLAEVAHLLAEHGISIATVHQNEGQEPVDVVILTHRAPDASMARALEGINSLPFVQQPIVHLRVEDLHF